MIDKPGLAPIRCLDNEPRIGSNRHPRLRGSMRGTERRPLTSVEVRLWSIAYHHNSLKWWIQPSVPRISPDGLDKTHR